jgi:hypothetical protein
MVHGDRNANPVPFAEFHGLADEEGIVDDVVVGQGRGLRGSRGAAGELDVDGVVELQRGGEFSQPLALSLAGHARNFAVVEHAGAGLAVQANHESKVRKPFCP